ncbi:alpha/beta hydrolase [Aquicoccus sp. G2-2]|uniref:alpha/beta hydrolase n=1 Tax=Aquicoccus sp. G2-2 TaxID=3092120 RepID=UPI002AE0535E|nr:alpha/beta hydrolase [Aquicoccus sp. G2-2]MEA1114479.1 alpha/beta hydrolase [Aquicoccus sp. G2-2]
MELDEAYANAAFIAGAEAFPGRWAEAARLWRAARGHVDLARLDLPYGQGERERFDLFLPEGPAKGLAMFVHGGYWLNFGRSDWSHLAAGAVAQGWAVALPSYTLCPAARISQITRQIARAVEVAADMVAGPIVLSGHSAGGHLVARMLAPGMLAPDVAARLRKVVPISPVADLRPLLKTSMNAELRLDQAEAEAESPVLMEERLDVPVTVWVGAKERPAFLDQAGWLAEAWGCERVVAEGRHHFDVIESLEIGDSGLVRTLLGA